MVIKETLEVSVYTTVEPVYAVSAHWERGWNTHTLTPPAIPTNPLTLSQF